MQYAGNNGYVYEVEVRNVDLTSLKDSRTASKAVRKPANSNREILVAKPENLHIVDTWQVIKHKRHDIALIAA